MFARLTAPTALAGSFAGTRSVAPRSDNGVVLFSCIISPLILLLSFFWPYQRYNPFATSIFGMICYNLGLLAVSRGAGKNPALVLSLYTLKFLSAYLVLYFGWFATKDWDRSVVYIGFDPATYDAFAAWVVESGEPLHNFMNLEDMGNYPYIINLYATLYSFLGSSVLNAASFNSLLIGLGYYFFYRSALSLGARENVSRYLAFMFVIPELIYFTAMPGKESSSLVVAAAVTFLVFEIRHLKDFVKPEFLIALLVVALLTGVRKHILASVLAISLVIRLVMTFEVKRPVLTAFVAIYLLIALGAIVSSGILAKQIHSSLGGGLVFQEEAVAETVKNLEAKQELMFSANSITRRFIPYTVSQTILFLPVRTAFYLVAPFPPQFLGWKNESIGDWFTPMTSFLGVFGLLTFGLMVSALFASHKHVLSPHAWVPFSWMCGTLAIVSYSFFTIHERYRLYSIPMWLIALYFGVRSPHRILFLGLNIAFVLAVIFLYLILRA